MLPRPINPSVSDIFGASRFDCCRSVIPYGCQRHYVDAVGPHNPAARSGPGSLLLVAFAALTPAGLAPRIAAALGHLPVLLLNLMCPQLENAHRTRLRKTQSRNR